jgi:hypothetical protein
VSATENGDSVSEHPSDAEAQRPPEIDPDALERIAARARRLVRERLRAVLDGRTAATPAPPGSELDDELLDQIADEEAERADGALLHVAVIHAVSEELGIEIEDALGHPAVDHVRDLLRPVDEAEPADADIAGDDGPRARPPLERALLLDAVHVFGIETLQPGDSDIELRLADVGIDVRKPSTAETIGRLRWDEVRTVAVQRPRRGLPGRRRPALFVAGTDRGEVTFELPGVSDEEITEHVEPLIARNCAGYPDPNAG